MLIEVGFDPCRMTHVDLRQCMAPGEGAFYIVLATVALIAMTPRVLRPFLRLIGDTTAEESLCVPEEKENLVFALVGVISSIILLWWFTPISADPEPTQRLYPLGPLLAASLMMVGFAGGGAMLYSLVQRSMDRVLGRGFMSLLGVASSLSCVAALAVSDSLASLIWWFPSFLVVGALARDLERMTWKVTRTVAVVAGAAIALSVVREVVETLL